MTDVMRYATVTFSIPVTEGTSTAEVIEKLCKELDKQNFSWELNQYSLDEVIGSENG